MLTLTVLTVIALGTLCYGWVSKRKNLQIVPAVALVVIAVTSFAMFSQPVDTYEPELAMADFGTGQTVTLYKSQIVAAVLVTLKHSKKQALQST